MKGKLIRYSMQIAMLGQLLSLALITEKEFSLIKNKLIGLRCSFRPDFLICTFGI